jgi:peroxiredoxin
LKSRIVIFIVVIVGALSVVGGGLIFSRSKTSLKIGDTAPDFTLTDQNGTPVKLSDFRGKKNVVLAFYIKAFTSGWTRELKAYQGDIAKFESAGTQVIGISVDARTKNKAYAEELGLKFPILSDEQKTVSRAYGVLIPLVKLASRTTYIINKEGVIRQIQKGGEALDPENAHEACSKLAHRN